MQKSSHKPAPLGQHFLTRANTASKIADAAHLTETDTVLEIGPGHGILTHELLKRAGHVVAIEKDPTLVTELTVAFATEIAEGRLQLQHADVRSFDPYTLHPTPYTLVANIPYYITGAILRQFLTTPHQPETITVLIQKEVAQRIVAQDGKQSLLSLSVQAFGTPRLAHTVKAGAFNPPPKVDSAVLVVEHVSRKHFSSTTHEERFFTTLRAAFAGKRKQLGSTLKSMVTAEALANAGIENTARPEDVQLHEWLTLAAQ